MTRATVFGFATWTFWMSVMSMGCSDNPGAGTQATASSASGSAGSQTSAASPTSPAVSHSGAVQGKGSAGASGSRALPPSSSLATAGHASGAAAPAASQAGHGEAAASAGAAAAPGSAQAAADGGVTSAEDAGAAAGAAAMASAGAGGQAGSSAAQDKDMDIPAPVDAPLVWGFGLGITDVPAATKFYSEVMKMSVEKDSVKREESTETTLYGMQAMRGARVVLMKFDDMRNTRKITTKLVWQAQNPAAVDAAASMYPDYVSRLNFGIVQFDGPETYIQEVGSSFDDGGAGISVPYPVAIGFAVSDQPASRKFYMALGMTESSLGTFTVTDATGTGSITEYTVKYDDGMGIVLQQWTPMRNAKDNPVKVILLVPDAKAVADKVSAAGGTIVKPAERSPAYDNRLLVVAKDLDGYVLDIVQ